MEVPVAVTLSPELVALQAKVRAFAEQEIAPISAERDRLDDPLAPFPWEVWRKASRLGLRTLPMPAEYGGIAMDHITHTVLLEELCVVDCGFGASFHQTWKFQKLVLVNDFVREHYLPGFLADDDYMFCNGATEPDTGSEHILSYDGLDGGLRSTAVQQPNGDWILNGKKHFVFAGGIAKGIGVLMRTNPKKGMTEGVTFFFLEQTTPGFRYGHVHNKMGWRLSPNGELIFEDCRIPDGNRLSEIDRGQAFRASFGRNYGTGTQVFAIATARAIFEKTLAWCQTHTRNGRPLIEYQDVALRLADLWGDVELARTLNLKTTWSLQHNPDHDRKLNMATLLFGAEMLVRGATSAMAIWGEEGIRRNRPIEKLFRDIFANYHIDGLNDLARIRLGSAFTSGQMLGVH